MKHFCFWVVTFFLGFTVLFTVGEVCFRLFRGAPNPLIEVTQKQEKYLFEPNSVKESASSVEGEFKYTAHINRFGYRGKDFTMPKQEGVLRIFVVGDSFTYGVGAEDNETIPYQIEVGANGRSPLQKVEVINAGVGHTGPLRHYYNLKDIHLQYQPDLVLVLFDLTDLWDDWHLERNAVYGKDGEVDRFDPLFINGKRSLWLTAVNYSAFCRWINDKIVRSVRKMMDLGLKEYIKTSKDKGRVKAVIATSESITDENVILEYDGMLMMRGLKRKAIIDKQWHNRTAKYLSKIKQLLDENNVPMILVAYPHGIYVGGNQWSEGRKFWGFEEGKRYTDYYPFELLSQFADKEGIPFINTLDDFLGAPADQKYFYDWDGHMTPAGYKIVAESIVRSKVFQDLLLDSGTHKGLSQ